MLPAENESEKYEAGAMGMADFGSLSVEDAGNPQATEDYSVRNKESAALFQMLLDQENLEGKPLPEMDEAPEMSMDIQAIELQGMSNYMDMRRSGLMADGSKATQLTEIAQDTDGQWLYKDTISTEKDGIIVSTARAASLALLRAKILEKLHQGKPERSGVADDGGEEEERPTDLTYDLKWDEAQKGYILSIRTKDRTNLYGIGDEIPDELQEELSNTMAPYWTINFKNQDAFIQKSDIYFGSFIDELLDKAWDKDLTGERERPRDDTTIDILLSNCIKEYNRLKVT